MHYSPSCVTFCMEKYGRGCAPAILLHTKCDTYSLPPLQIRLVLVGTHEAIKLGWIAHLHGDHPTLVIGAIVDKFGLILQRFVDFHHLAADRRNKFRGRLDRLDIAELCLVRDVLSCIPG